MNKKGNASAIFKCNGTSQRFTPVIKNPTICPNCKIVYSHSNQIKELDVIHNIQSKIK